MYIDRPGKVELVYTSEDGEEKRSLVQEFKAPGVVDGYAQYVLHPSKALQEAASIMRLDTKQDRMVWCAKIPFPRHTMAKFKEVFQTIFDSRI